MNIAARIPTAPLTETKTALRNDTSPAFPRRITLCGSTRFKRAFLEWNRRLTLQGHLIYSVAFWTHAGEGEPSRKDKQALDLVHKRKIEVFVDIHLSVAWL
jgi:hypothetical protein